MDPEWLSMFCTNHSYSVPAPSPGPTLQGQDSASMFARYMSDKIAASRRGAASEGFEIRIVVRVLVLGKRACHPDLHPCLCLLPPLHRLTSAARTNRG